MKSFFWSVLTNLTVKFLSNCLGGTSPSPYSIRCPFSARNLLTYGRSPRYILPVAAAAGETYRFCWSGVAADADDVLFVAPSADALTFTGGILDFKTDETGAGIAVIVYPGADDDKLSLVNPDGFDITFTAVTTTKYVVSGWAASTDTHAAFGDI